MAACAARIQTNQQIIIYSTKSVEGPSRKAAETVSTTKGEQNGKKSSRKNQASNRSR